MPRFCKNMLADCLAFIIYIVDKKHRDIVHKNIDFFLDQIVAKDDIKSVSKQTYKMFARYMLDAIEGKTHTKESLDSIITPIGNELFDQMMKDGKKIITVTAHFGQWEFIAPYLISHYNKVFVTIGKRFGDSQKLTDALFDQREKSGIETHPKRGAMRALVKAMNDSSKLVGFLPDQSTSEGASVQFFGKEILWIDTMSRLARQFDATIFPIYIASNDMQNHNLIYLDPITPDLSIEKEQDIKRMAQLEASSLEKVIKDYPSNYFWFHKRAKREYPEVYR